jgi:hypothetical protein
MLSNQLIKHEILDLLKKVKTHQYSPLFLQPIQEVIDSFPNYAVIVTNPIDLGIISNKLQDGQYLSVDDFKSDIELLINNCKTFNSFKKSWAHKAAESIEAFFCRELKKSQIKIQKYQQMAMAQPAKTKHENVASSNNNGNYQDHGSSNIQVVSSSEDEKISKKIKNLFQKLGANLNVNEVQREEIIALIVKSIVKRNKSFEQIYEDTMKFLSKNLNNVNNIKSYFSRKFRKLLRSIKEEQSEGVKNDKAFNIKINLNESEEKKEEKDKLDSIRKEVLNFIDVQKIPEVFRNVAEYPLEPSVRKKINTYIGDIKSNFISQY